MNEVSTKYKEIYTPADIVWFKNVTNSERGEAYLDLSEDIFSLHFPNKHKTNILTPKINEIILIYQKVNGMKAFTHLVTPVDELLIDEGRSEFRFARRVRVIAKTNKENFIHVSETLWETVNLGGITQGNACRINKIKSVENIDELKLDIWNRFNGYFIKSEQDSKLITSSIIADLELENTEFIAKEGGLSLVSHVCKERNRNIINEKKRRASVNNQLTCEVCGFSFIMTYQVNFIECHHLIPIGQGGIRETTLDDLALVCANCHRMLHKRFNGHYLSIKQLREKMNEIK